MFWLLIALFCILMFYYVIWRFFVIFGNNSKIIPLIIAIILAITVMWTFMFSWNNKVLDIIWTISSWIFVLWFLLMILLLIENIVHIWYKINPRITVWLIILILWLWVYFALHTKIINLDIETDKIQKNVKILLVSDIHTEHITQDFHVKKIIKAIKEEKPDFVMIAWDMMNKPNRGYIDYLKAFKSIKDTPIVAVEWNHDVMWNTQIVNDIPNKSGIKLLNNESIEIEGIQLIWIIDKSLRWNSVEQTMSQINFNENQNLFTILITHQPIWLEKLQDYSIDLEVAWHTHRGQFYWMRKVVKWMNDYAYWEYKLWDRTAFVTQWIWTRWLPFRLWTQSEMVIINLIKK